MYVAVWNRRHINRNISKRLPGLLCLWHHSCLPTMVRADDCNSGFCDYLPLAENRLGLLIDVAEIHYKSLDRYFEKLNADAEETGSKRPSPAPVYLIFGEEFLCRTVLKDLLNTLLPAGSTSLNIERVDGPNEDIRDVIERVTTYSLLSETKIVVVDNSGIFDSKQDTDHLINKSRQAFHDDDIQKAANYLLNLMGLLDLSYQDLSPENRSKTLTSKWYASDDNQWLDAVLGYCMQEGLPVPSTGQTKRIAIPNQKRIPSRKSSCAAYR